MQLFNYLRIVYLPLSKPGVNESALPYEGLASSCQVAPGAERNFIYSWESVIEGWSQDPSQNREVIKKALIEKGPLITKMYLGPEGSFDENGIYKCNSIPLINHSVALTGYNDTGDIHTSYWEAKNSFGSAWNGDGYFKIGWDYQYSDYEGFYDQCESTSFRPLYVEVSQPPIPPPIDITPPVVTIASPTSENTYSTNTTPLIVSGSSIDNVGTTQVSWVNNRGGSGNCTGTSNWICGNIPLVEGVNNLTVNAKDAANNFGADSLEVTYIPPVEPPPVSTLNLVQTPLNWGGSRYGIENPSLVNGEMVMQCTRAGRNTLDKEISFPMSKYSEVTIEAYNPSQLPIKIRLGYEAKDKSNSELRAFYLSSIKTLNPGNNIITLPQNSFTLIAGASSNNYSDLEKALLEIQCPQNYQNTQIRIKKIELK